MPIVPSLSTDPIFVWLELRFFKPICEVHSYYMRCTRSGRYFCGPKATCPTDGPRLEVVNTVNHPYVELLIILFGI